jgi:hypothetical protein
MILKEYKRGQAFLCKLWVPCDASRLPSCPGQACCGRSALFGLLVTSCDVAGLSRTRLCCEALLTENSPRHSSGVFGETNRELCFLEDVLPDSFPDSDETWPAFDIRAVSVPDDAGSPLPYTESLLLDSGESQMRLSGLCIPWQQLPKFCIF